MNRNHTLFHVSTCIAVCLAPVAVVRGAEPTASNETTLVEAAITDDDRAHWAFRPLRRPEPPRVQRADWVRNPIDQFILNRLEREQLTPLPPADRVTLIRRVTFDLIGLPPTPEQIDSFVQDSATDAYEKLIDRLLASPRYGPRWAQHWLDLARFAETDGFEQDHLRPNAWRYRDWVIDAFNRDLPFDEFVRLQIAGDELRPDDPDAAVATGFALCGPDMSDINEVAERRHMVLNDIAATVSSVFLGLQMGCAQCHDHKFDPISQADFYRLRAFFEPSELFRDQPLAPRAHWARIREQKKKIEKQRREINRQIKALEQSARKRLATEKTAKGFKPGPTALLAALTATEREQYKTLKATRDNLRKQASSTVPEGRVFREHDAAVQPAYLRVRGDFRRRGPQVRPAYPRIANRDGETVAALPKSGPSSGLRTALANWLTRPDHPLVTRVLVNRVWQHHFGQGLVRSPSDFGRMGEEPSHPELLDWLATELPRRGWRLSVLHKLILTSATYGQASRSSNPQWTPAQRAAAAENGSRSRRVDPENRLLARQNRNRLDAESIRDALLFVAGRLSPRQGGRGVMPPLPREIRNQIRRDHWTVSPNEEDHRRRSIYLFVRRNLRYPLFDVFDRPDTNASCPKRNRSTTAPQSLALLNSELSLESARFLAGGALRHAGSDARAHVDWVYRKALGRTPAPEEQTIAVEFLTTEAAQLRIEGREPSELALPQPSLLGTAPYRGAALTSLCLSLLNLNEFIYVD